VEILVNVARETTYHAEDESGVASETYIHEIELENWKESVNAL